MILVDTNQLTISHLMVRRKFDNEINIDNIRRSVVKTIATINRLYKTEYGEVILCYDSKNYWRKSVFPYYKQNRKKEREQSGLDWELIFNTLNTIRDELRDNLPYKVLCVDGAESDDIIAILTIHRQNNEPILILSQDKDFVQLQKFNYVKQYDLTHRKWIICENPEKTLREHIIRGDRSDGIPNILTSDDVFVSGKVQKTMSKEKIDRLTSLDPTAFNNYVRLRNWKRNSQLIDFNQIPDKIINDVIVAYHREKPKNSVNLEYFSRNNMTDLLNLF